MSGKQTFRAVYQPYVFVEVDESGELKVEFDWSDTYMGYELGENFIEHLDPEVPEYEKVKIADSFLEKFIGERGLVE